MASTRIKDLLKSRVYRIVFCEAGFFHQSEESLFQILTGEEMEYHFALQDIDDELLGMKVDETIAMDFNRDFEDSKGIITRIK